jgi:hypothetical protein
VTDTEPDWRHLNQQQMAVIHAAVAWAWTHGLREPPGQSWRQLEQRDTAADLLAAVDHLMNGTPK